ncbi:MAG: non-homologous end-joining DNA ligase [Actinomycetota bacterium]
MVSTVNATGPDGWVRPMKAVLGPLPAGDEWAFELKWDGVRVQAHCRPSTDPSTASALTLFSMSGRDVTSHYPELADLASALALPAVIDGEVVVFDGDQPSFGRLQHRMHVSRPTPNLVVDHPVWFVAFDLLALDDRSILDLPLRQRRSLLGQILDDGARWRVSPQAVGQGDELLAIATERGLEGVMAKRLDSRYRPGRSSDWVKVKLRRRQEFVVGGWLPGQGALEGTIGSLVIGVYSNGVLAPVGSVGSGLTDAERAILADLMRPAEHCPFGHEPELVRGPAVWVEPELVIEVEYGSWPADGNVRHPVYAGRRSDVDPQLVGRELPPDGRSVR